MRYKFSLTWLLLAFCAVFFCQSALGASLKWKRQGDGERLVFKFKTALPPDTSMRRGPSGIELPLPQDFWKKERVPKKTDFSASAFVSGVEYMPDAIFIRTGGAFEFSTSTRPRSRELIVEFRPSPSGSALSANDTFQNGTALDAVSSGVEPEFLSGRGHLRGKIFWPGRSPIRETAPQGAAANQTAVSSGPEASANRSVDLKPAGEPPSSARPEYLSGESANRTTGPPAQDSPAREPAAGTKPFGKKSASRGGRFVIEPVVVLPSLDHARPLPKKGEAPQEKESSSPAVPEDKLPTVLSGQEPAPQLASSSPAGPGAGKEEFVSDVLGTASAPGPEAVNAGDIQGVPAARDENIPADVNASDGTAMLPENASVPAANATANATEELAVLSAQARKALDDGRLDEARAVMETMLRHPGTSGDVREELLYTLADIAMRQGREDLPGNFQAILQAYEAAKNADVHSRNMPEALASLGYLHLAVGNVPEAKGYFDLLRRKYPDDPRVPVTDHYWGEHYLKRGGYTKAAEHFQYVVRNHPDSDVAAASTLGLLKAFMELGFFDKAMELVRTVEKRWPRHYLEDPSFLMTAGHAAMAAGRFDAARDYFWTYVNIVPKAPDVDMAMARIGDILMQQNRKDAAREIYHRAAEAYPDRDGGLIAQMRLAEEGVLDRPSVGDMAPSFGRSGMNPETVYNRILEKKDSPLAPVARLKLAMWRLWEKKYAEAVREIEQFQKDYPDHDLLAKAREVMDRALQDWLAADLAQGNYEAVLDVWNAHSGIFEGRDLSSGLRLTLATAQARTGHPEAALALAEPIVFSLPRDEYSEPGMDLVLSTLVEMQRWEDVARLAERVKPWKLGRDRQRQVDYAAALAQENLLRPDKARPLWEKLSTDMNLADTQRGYALYFLARATLDAGKVERSAVLAQEALNLFLKEKKDVAKIRDCLELLALAADRNDRFRDALAWTLEADEYIPEGDRDWPAHTYRKALRFRKNGDTEKWKENLEHIIRAVPDSLYSRMARAELEGARLEREVEKFR